MTDVPKRETRYKGERRPVVAASPPPAPRATAPTTKSTKRKAPGSPPPPAPPEPVHSRDPPGLPSLRERQDLDLPDAEWKSIPESGVLAASLKLSMEKWRHGGCFEKYWVKNPVKKVHRDFQNPPSTSMARLGSAVMTIEPHSFEVVLYSVKAPTPTVTGPTSKPTNPLPPSTAQHRPSGTSNAPLLAPEKAGKSLAPLAPVAPMSSQSKWTPKTGGQNAKNSNASGKANPPSTSNQQQSQSAKTITSNGTDSRTTGPPSTPTDPASNNPVIKELAHRASQDSSLKDLMKIVAQGGATEAQVKEFQRHIDEINEMLRAKSGANNPSKKTQQSSDNSRNTQSMTWTQPITPYVKHESSSKLKVPPPPRPDVSAVIFEILSGTGDRYLIPKKSLLEFREGTRLAVLSFLVHLKGKNANGGFYENEREYCELITFKLLADRPGILDSLRRAVDSPDVVRKHMQDWAGQMSVAEKAYLMLRLRSVPEDEQQSRPQTAMPVPKEEIAKSDYDAPNSLFPLRRQVVVGRQ